jgi:hypothetical protein
MVQRSLVFLLAITCAACTSSTKVQTQTISQNLRPELSAMEGKKVALVAVEGDDTSKKVIEVALVNVLVQRGTFILIPKSEIDAIRALPEQNPLDWSGIAQKAGADFALRAQVLEFSAETRQGYSTEEVNDSQIAAEQGTDGKTEQVFPVQKLEGKVRVSLEFKDLKTSLTSTAIAEAQDQIEANAKTSAIHLPPKLRYLENLTNKAFRDFFVQYN